MGYTRYSLDGEEECSLSPPDNTASRLPRLIKHTWSMCATAAPLSLAITLLYWTAIAPIAYGPETFGYVSVAEHGGIGLLILLDGLTVCLSIERMCCISFVERREFHSRAREW